jgi:mannose-6-phosphate isomerase
MNNYKEQRPWGEFEILLDAENTKVKRITVNPGGKLSYQYHHKRSEHWIIIEGTAHITLEDHEIIKTSGSSIYLPVEAKHRVENKQDIPLVLIEVQVGNYFGEDDIVRIEDIYNRK